MTKKTIVLTGFIALKFVLHYAMLNPDYELHRDEFLYLDQANHLAWGYLSVPPFTSWISSIVQFLGNSVFWIKFFPALFGALTLVVVWKAIEELKGNLFALILGATCVLFSAILKLNFLYQPNSFDVLAWTALYFVLIKYINTEKSIWLYIGALVFAIGFLNKYNILFLILGLFPALLLFGPRKMFLKKEFYLSILLVLLLILPNLVWQYQNNLPVVHHLKELTERQLVHNNRWDFLVSQIFDFVGSFFVIIAGLYALLFYPPIKKYKFFLATMVFTLLIFVYFRAKGYYGIGLHPIYVAFGSVFVAHLLSKGWKLYLRPVAILIPVGFFLLLFNVFFSNKSPDYILENAERFKRLGQLRWEDGEDHSLPQDYADMLGWKELARKIDSICEGIPDLESTLILCDNYGEAGAINYYTTNPKIKAVSFSADYVNWFDLRKPIQTFIRVKEQEDRKEEFDKTKPYFESGYMADSISNPLAREYGTTIFVFKGPKIDVVKRIRQEIGEVKGSE
ncbi:glycosyltransferase family 39 protein [Flavobacteriaceae bacterium F89]|uniref:Glycosyltransferase family 39 protein n=1 Tax=Cerina litoralis TaxID=2874477 RepID=A0AAE3ERE7_9FLAO|nr:glycosyltransferase family 39 protein [Cerina litoralis]MCG2459695.1 glycosyltransferase family 39 protein [Cerina litoralis]